MKKSKFDLIISIMLSLSIICFLLYILDNTKRLLYISEITFIISSILIIIHLIKNITLKRQPKIVKYDLNLNNIISDINERLINDSFIMSIDEIKENIRIKHYKKEINKTSMFMLSVIECNNLNETLHNIIKSSVVNQCKKDKHENVTYLYSIIVIIVDEINSYLIENIKPEFQNNMSTLTCGVSTKEKSLYILENDMKENIIKYHTSKEKLFNLLDIKEVKK